MAASASAAISPPCTVPIGLPWRASAWSTTTASPDPNDSSAMPISLAAGGCGASPRRSCSMLSIIFAILSHLRHISNASHVPDARVGTTRPPVSREWPENDTAATGTSAVGPRTPSSRERESVTLFERQLRRKRGVIGPGTSKLAEDVLVAGRREREGQPQLGVPHILDRMIDVARNEYRSLSANLVRDATDSYPRTTLVHEQDLFIGMPMRRHLPAGRQILRSHRERRGSCRPWLHEDLDWATAIFAAPEPENLTVAAPNDVVHRSSLRSSRISIKDNAYSTRSRSCGSPRR